MKRSRIAVGSLDVNPGLSFWWSDTQQVLNIIKALLKTLLISSFFFFNCKHSCWWGNLTSQSPVAGLTHCLLRRAKGLSKGQPVIRMTCLQHCISSFEKNHNCSRFAPAPQGIASARTGPASTRCLLVQPQWILDDPATVFKEGQFLW